MTMIRQWLHISFFFALLTSAQQVTAQQQETPPANCHLETISLLNDHEDFSEIQVSLNRDFLAVNWTEHCTRTGSSARNGMECVLDWSTLETYDDYPSFCETYGGITLKVQNNITCIHEEDKSQTFDLRQTNIPECLSSSCNDVERKRLSHHWLQAQVRKLETTHSFNCESDHDFETQDAKAHAKAQEHFQQEHEAAREQYRQEHASGLYQQQELPPLDYTKPSLKYDHMVQSQSTEKVPVAIEEQPNDGALITFSMGVLSISATASSILLIGF